MSDEAHFSAEQPGSRTAARISRPDGYRRRPGRDSRAPCTRSQEIVGIAPNRAGSVDLVTRPLHQRKIPVISARKDFLAANSAKRAPSGGMVVLVRTRGDDDARMRLGITVTKKIGNAVVRNRMKRRFRALAREILPEYGLVGADHVMIGRASAIARDFAALRGDLTRALEKIRR